MARGLIASPHTKTTSHLIFTSISRTGLLSEFPKHSPHLSSSSLPSSRFLCSCSKNQHGLIDLSNYRETFAKRMAMAGLKPHHHLGINFSKTFASKNQIDVLMTAHHADDQAELFILRLSHGSGVLGLSGMAFVSQLFQKSLGYSSETLSGHGVLLVRPLLEFSKEDMYQVGVFLISVNRKQSNSIFMVKLQAVISACRKTRLHVDKICSNLINQAVTITPEGYAVINLKILHPCTIDDMCLSKFLTLVLQFVSQRRRPILVSSSQLLFDYIRTSPCKTCLTAARCYLCPAPGSKGSKDLICCDIDSNVPLKMEVI
ncbi:hypothetical protein ACH5RR_004207 [Cinchona calisaya]|uniref:tRNA(Ile)-lysidine/2-thiocytidine synthase N-terminal domain-containing protein n=1 Tax=Cinchona calisaya TaxID=153742 RepID=A0ABD3AXD1_9GENT